MVLTKQQIKSINKPVIDYRLRLFTAKEPIHKRTLMWKYYETLLAERKVVLARLKEL